MTTQTNQSPTSLQMELGQSGTSGQLGLGIESTKPKKLKVQQVRSSLICAVLHVSESEIIEGYPLYNFTWETDRPTVLKQILWEFGMDTNQDFKRQDAILHRNRLNQQVMCSRWYGNERSDKQWLESGYASKEALDRSQNNSVLDSLYRERALTVDTQSVLEARDLYYENKEIKQASKQAVRKKNRKDKLEKLDKLGEEADDNAVEYNEYSDEDFNDDDSI